jgi:DoxX-like family
MVVILSIALAVPLVIAAVRKLGHGESTVRSYARVGVPEQRLNTLAVILLAGAAGLVAGVVWEPIGLAATIGVVAYFLLAVAAHVRFHDQRNLPAPALILMLAAALLLVRVM